MDFKRLVRPFALPVWKMYWSLRNRRSRLWAGVYASYRSAPSSGAGFGSPEYVEDAVAATARAIAAARPVRGVPDGVLNPISLPLLASTIPARNSGRLRILDYGGGLGISYLDVLGTAASCTGLDYHVVELEWACREGARMFAHDGRIRFHRSLPPDLQQVDIVYASGVLMYVEDYAALLRRLCSYHARYVLFETLAAGAFPTFASTQVNIGPGTVPHWFFDIDEIVRLVEAEGYALAFRNAEALSGAHDNFDPEHQLDKARYWSLLFERTA